jgi:hypothetical protein
VFNIFIDANNQIVETGAPTNNAATATGDRLDKMCSLKKYEN